MASQQKGEMMDKENLADGEEIQILATMAEKYHFNAAHCEMTIHFSSGERSEEVAKLLDQVIAKMQEWTQWKERQQTIEKLRKTMSEKELDQYVRDTGI